MVLDVDALRDDQWERFATLCRAEERSAGSALDNWRFVDALLWLARAGAGVTCPNVSVTIRP